MFCSYETLHRKGRRFEHRYSLLPGQTTIPFARIDNTIENENNKQLESQKAIPQPETKKKSFSSNSFSSSSFSSSSFSSNSYSRYGSYGTNRYGNNQINLDMKNGQAVPIGEWWMFRPTPEWFRESAKFVPVRLDLKERKFMRLVQQAMSVIDYTSSADLPEFVNANNKAKARRVYSQVYKAYVF